MEVEEDFNYSYTYPVNNSFIDVSSLQELIDGKNIRKENYPYDYIFIELPSIVYNNYPLRLIGLANSILYIVSATSDLKKADRTALATFDEVCLKKPMVILNEVELYNLEELLSAIPKSKNRVMYTKIKYIITYPFRYKIQIKKEEA